MVDKVSIVIPCRNEKSYLKEMLASFKVTIGKELLEIIIVDDGSTDGGCDFLEKPGFTYPWPVKLIKTKNQGPAQARNYGADNAAGEFLLFCDAHLIVDDPAWISKILAGFTAESIGAVCPGVAAKDKAGAVGFGGTLDRNLTFSWLGKPKELTNIPIGPGGCIAIRKDIFWEIGGFEEEFPAWGYEDIEISIKMWLFGHRIVVNPNVQVAHVFRAKHPYPIKYTDVDFNLLWMAICHFNQQRLLKVAGLVNAREGLNYNLERLAHSAVWQKSLAYRSRRKFDDDWYFQEFKIPF